MVTTIKQIQVLLQLQKQLKEIKQDVDADERFVKASETCDEFLKVMDELIDKTTNQRLFKSLV